MSVVDIFWCIFLIVVLVFIWVDGSKSKRNKKDSPKPKPVLLIDMDGVIADYYGHFVRMWKLRHPNRAVVHPDDLTNMYLEVDYPAEYETDIRSINTSVGFFEGMLPIKGAPEVLNRILDEGKFEVFLCSTPDSDSVNHSCSSEKVRWVELVLGKRWLKRIILAHDKTLVSGHFLIDDKPNIKGVANPSWKHIIFTHAYNKSITDKPRLNKWEEWGKLEHNLLAEYNQTK